MARPRASAKPRRVFPAYMFIVFILVIASRQVLGREGDQLGISRTLSDEIKKRHGGGGSNDRHDADSGDEDADSGDEDDNNSDSDDGSDTDGEEDEEDEAKEKCADDGTCSSAIRGYDMLLDEPDEPWHSERPETCDDSEFWTLDWKPLQEFKSKYQHVEFCQDPRNDDVCLDLDNIIQICASYRPHYHELMVHYPARYLPQLRRVVFIGGGDSLLLHEVLKYPELELVVGLELDQQVTRGSYKFFGSQPHWDDPRVEWWYGDATKSLMVLPKEYYGSFDLVLVDLSETVMALSVTDELDVMQSLALLLKPDGVFVQNEIMHFFEISRLFQYTMHSHLYDIPIVCSQSVIIGSHTVDLFRKPATKHQVPYLLSRVLDDDDWMTQLVHDFQRNMSNVPAGDRICRPSNKKQGGNDPAAASAPLSGVLMVADAENLSDERVQSPESVLAATFEAMKGQGFEVASTSVASGVYQPSSSEPSTVHRASLILYEGYVLIHCIPGFRFCSVDIHLWTHLDRQARLRSAIVSALADANKSGPEIKVSSFRIVTGGMSGARGYEEDAKNRGLLSVPACEAAPDAGGEGATNSDAGAASAEHQPDHHHRSEQIDPASFHWPLYRQALQRTTDLLPPNGAKEGRLVAVLCGHGAENDGDPAASAVCESAAALRAFGGGDAYHVLELRACADLTDGIEYSKHATVHYQRCEGELIRAITAFVRDQKRRLDAIVVDPTAPFTLGQIVLHIFQSKVKRSRMLAEHRLVVAPAVKPWHGVFVDRFRTQVFAEEPLFRAEVLLRGAEGTAVGVALCSSGDALFVRRLNSTLADLQPSLPEGSTDVRVLRGAWKYSYLDSEPAGAYTHLDYDQTGPFAQWQAQTQIMQQAVAQFVVSPDASPMSAPITAASIRSAVESAAAETFGRDAASQATWLVESSSIGDGAVIVAMLDAWTAAVMWDGKSSMTANIVSYDTEDDSFGVELILGLKEAFELETALFDQHPRGTGSVVNWREDTEGVFPIWAEALKASAEVS
jgi:spermidine synthase